MSVEQNIDQAGSIMHTLSTADFIPNTFGTISGLSQTLQQIASGLEQTAMASLDSSSLEKLKKLITKIEDNRLLFAIPETWLIDQVYRAAKQIRQKIGD